MGRKPKHTEPVSPIGAAIRRTQGTIDRLEAEIRQLQHRTEAEATRIRKRIEGQRQVLAALKKGA